MAIAAVFSICVCFTMELRAYARDRFGEQYCPDVFVYALGNMGFEENFPELSLLSNIDSAHALKGKYISAPVKHGDANISSITNMACVLEDTEYLRYMDFIEGGLGAAQPNAGEIWITSTLANSYGISVGDVLRISYVNPVELTVSAIFAATFAPSERLTIMPNIINPETLGLLSHERDTGVWALNLYETGEDYVNQLAMGDKYALLTFSRERLSSYVTDITGVVGSVSGIAALVVFMAALLIMRFVMQNHLQKEIRFIGIYQALGYRVKYIVSLYMKGYCLIGCAAVLVGALCSIPISYYLGNGTAGALGRYRLTDATYVSCAACIIILTILLLGGARLAMRNLHAITPVEALFIGSSSGERKIAPSLIQNASSPLSMAINEVFKHKQASAVTLLALSISIYLILFFASSYQACENIYEHANIWLACPRFNAIITGDIDDDLILAARGSPYVKTVVSGDFFYYPPIRMPQYDGNARSVEFVVIDDPSENASGIAMENGGSPADAGEIAVSVLLLQELGMDIGDALTIAIDTRSSDFRITGAFASMEGLAIIMPVEGMKNINENYYQDNCFITLRENANFSSFKRDIESRFPAVAVAQEWTALKTAILAIENMLTSIMKVMLAIFIVFAAISIVNVMTLGMNSKKRQFGILKSLGFSANYLILQNLLYIIVFFITGSLIASALHLALSERLFAMAVIDAMESLNAISGMLLLGTGLLIAGISYCLGNSIKKITPTELFMEE
jgi:putative ABC transport system permease protein